MYETLLFLHVLTAAALFVTTVMFSAYVLGAPVEKRSLDVARILWAFGGLGTLVFGIALAIDVDGYEIWDGWIILAIALWALATECGRRAEVGVVASATDSVAAVSVDSRVALMHWARVALVVALLVVMVWKPGA
jgi:hypothetical protein